MSAVRSAPTRPREEERERDAKEMTKDSDRKEWKQVVGGFVPKLLKRDAATPYPSVQMVNTIEDYKRVVIDEQHRIVVVRFFAPWCKSCKASRPQFKKMVARHAPGIKFVEVPLTRDTAFLHEGLGVPSVPFGHIYHPEAGLVEEEKINNKVVKRFQEALESYVRGSCDLPTEEDPEDDGAVEDGFQ